MSGGSLDYFCYTLEDHADDLGDKELNDLVKDLAKLFHDREWFLSGDTCEGTWNEARDAFKAKWFTEHGRQERIEKYLAEFEDEVRKTFGMSKRYCGYCGHWEMRDNGPYGKCEFANGWLNHRSECCDRWEEHTDV